MKVTKQCEKCGSQFERTAGNSALRFCSRLCYLKSTTGLDSEGLQARKKLVKEMSQQGYRHREIAEYFRVSRQKITEILKEN